MSLFPTYIATNIDAGQEGEEIPVEYEIDWVMGRLTGRMVSGREAIKTWIKLALQTPRYRYMVYTWDYGNDLEELIGHNYSREYLETEIKRMVEECLKVNGQIGQITDFTEKLERDKLVISFAVDTPYGSIYIQNERIDYV